jgi:hypothetical protein
MSTAFSGTAFKKVWESLDANTIEQIKGKAQWEHMTLSAVMHSWWPDLWKRVEQEERREKAMPYLNRTMRTCRTLHHCELCDDGIRDGQSYYDGGYSRRAHVGCVKDWMGI